jgi:hypothetical protein
MPTASSRFEACLEQPLLGAEVVVDQRLRDAGLLGDRDDRGRGEPARAEVLGGDVEDLRLPVQARHALGTGVGSDHARKPIRDI